MKKSCYLYNAFISFPRLQCHFYSIVLRGSATSIVCGISLTFETFSWFLLCCSSCLVISNKDEKTHLCSFRSLVYVLAIIWPQYRITDVLLLLSYAILYLFLIRFCLPIFFKYFRVNRPKLCEKIRPINCENLIYSCKPFDTRSLLHQNIFVSTLFSLSASAQHNWNEYFEI